MSAAPFCASSPEAAAMSDADFWAHVYPDDPEPDIDPYEGEPGPVGIADPCPECGAAGACGYDDEGRPMIHAVEDTP
jgi:hypothetical protein